jgi:hypothetical protein
MQDIMAVRTPALMRSAPRPTRRSGLRAAVPGRAAVATVGLSARGSSPVRRFIVRQRFDHSGHAGPERLSHECAPSVRPVAAR